MDTDTLRHLVANARALLLDFDGPVCSVFAGLPAPVVVDQLCRVLVEGGHDDLPVEVTKSEDPFEVLAYSATLGESEARYVNAALTAHEVEATITARPTPNAHDLIRAWWGAGRAVAIVSNNSTLAIEAYLGRYGMQSYVTYVSGRCCRDPALLKPSPYLIENALTSLAVPAETTIFIGDSVTDVQAGLAAGVIPVGYVNKPGKANRLISAGAYVLTSELVQLWP